MTHPGKVRANNEDHFLVAKLAKSMRICQSSLPETASTRFSDEEGYLMIVADGMGGAAAGEMASALAVWTVESFVLDTLKWFLHLGSKEESALAAELRQGLERADREVIERARTDGRPGRHGDDADDGLQRLAPTCISSTPATRGRTCSATASSSR